MRSVLEELLRADLPSFIGKTLSTCDPAAHYLPNWHIDLIAEHLLAAERGEMPRLIINMPPRALKSICVSVAWPAWLLGHDPRRRIIAASYAASLAVKHSLDTRAVLASRWFGRCFPEVKLARDQNEKHKFMTTARGFRFATSVGGSVTGEGGNFLIMDDPLSPAQAASRTLREYANHWFEHTFASRLNDRKNGVIVLVMQRLHEDDLTGHLLKKGGWTHLSLPMVESEKRHYDMGRVRYARQAGELLQSERMDEKAVQQLRIDLGSQAFSAQYQQAPVPQEGAMLRAHWLEIYSAVPENTRIVQSWDTAIKSGAQHDASVCITFAEHEGKSHVLDVCVVRLEYPDLKKLMCKNAEKWLPQAILLEDKASGQQLLQDLKRETSLPLIARIPKGDKITRFAAVSAMIEGGRLLLPRSAPWLADFTGELLSFPHGKNDDQVDALTQYLCWLREQKIAHPNMRRI